MGLELPVASRIFMLKILSSSQNIQYGIISHMVRGYYQPFERYGICNCQIANTFGKISMIVASALGTP
jgi:hypothetical protein